LVGRSGEGGRLLVELDELIERDAAALGARERPCLADGDGSQPREQRGAAVGLAAQQDDPRALAGVLDQRRC